MKKTRIMFAMLQLDAGGSERVVLDLARNLNSEQYEIYVTAFKGGALEISLREVCKAVFFIRKRKGFDFLAMCQLAKLIRENDIDVVNAHHYMPCFYSFLGAKILSKKRLIYTEHSVPEVEQIASSIHGKVFFWMLFRINGVIGVSGQITEKFRQFYPIHADKFLPILNGVDVEKFRTDNKRDHIRKEFGILKSHFIIGSVANFRKVKNHTCLIRAAARLQDSHPQIRLFFVGTGFPDDSENSEDEIRESIRVFGMQNKVIMAGYKRNIAEILSAFDLFCLPSFSEGLPVSILEAMAVGIPVIGSDVKGTAELIKHRENGFLFNSNDDKDLSDKIETIMKNPSFVKLISANAYNYVKTNHDIQKWVGNYACIFQDSDYSKR